MLLASILNSFLDSIEHPQSWKLAFISNVYKKGDQNSCSKYKIVSVTNLVDRSYGKIIQNRIEAWLQEVEDKYGYRDGYSALTEFLVFDR